VATSLTSFAARISSLRQDLCISTTTQPGIRSSGTFSPG
jgi:hypothetical protein